MAKKKIIVLPKHLAIYIRVSTDKQAIEGISVDNQLDKGMEVARKLGWTYHIYSDAGLSGSISYFERPALNRLMLDIEQNKIGGLYSFDIDRWSRDPSYIEPQIIITKFIESKIKIFTNSGEQDLGNSGVAMTMRLKGFFASYERLLTKERVISALEKSMKDGKNAGGGQLQLYGYNSVNKALVINEEEANVVKNVYKYYLEGHGTKVISNLLNEGGIKTKRNSQANGKMTIKKGSKNKTTGEYEIIKRVVDGSEFHWSDTTIYNMLKNTTYIGQKKYKDIIIPAPRIIDDQTFGAVQNLLKEKMKFKRAPYTNVGKQVNHFLLKGLIRCAMCGKGFYGHKRVDLKDKAYKCLSHRYKAQWCGNRGLDIDYLDNLVWNSLQNIGESIISSMELRSKQSEKMYKAEMNHYESMGAEANKNLIKLERRYTEGDIKKQSYEALAKEYEYEIKKWEAEVKQIKKTFYLIENKGMILDIVKHFTDGIKEVKTFEEKQSFIRGFVSHIAILTYRDDSLENKDKPIKKQVILIHYKFDEISQYYIKDEIDILYKNNWQRICSETKPFRMYEYDRFRDTKPVDFTKRIEVPTNE